MVGKFESVGEPLIVVGQTGEQGEPGTPGAKGDNSRLEISSLSAAVEKLAAAMTVLAEANTNLSDRFQTNATATTKRVKTAVYLNVVSTVLALLILPAVWILHDGLDQVHSAVNTVHATQTTNSGIVASLAAATKADTTILQIISQVTSPAVEKASNAHIVALVNHLELCLQNHGDRARDILAHIPPPKPVAGCVGDS